MKAFKKIVLAMLISCLLVVPFAGTAHAEDLADPDAMKSMLDYFGIDLNDPASIQNAIDEIKEGGLSGMLNMLGIDVNEILDELQYYLDDMSETTSPIIATPTISETTTTEATTEAGTTAEPASSAPPTQTPTYPSKPLPVKPAASTTKAPAETTEEETTATDTTEEEKSSTEEVSEESVVIADKTAVSTFSENTLYVIFITLIIFIAGLGTGIFVSRRISERQRERDE